MQTIVRIGLLGLIACAVCIVLTWVVRAIGRRRALLDGAGASGHVKPVMRAVPNIGGVAIFWSIVAAMAVVFALAENPVTPHTMILFVTALGVHIVGLIDDRRPLGPAPKLIAQVIAGLVPPVFLGVRSLELLDAHVGGPWLSIAITTIWFVVVINAINFMDNMDGIAASCAGIAGAILAVIALRNWDGMGAALPAAIAGACAGFLVFNAPRRGRSATIFMGDGGSLVLGFLLAYATVRVSYVADVGSARLSAIFVPLCVLAIPLYDLVAVCAIRVTQGKSPLVGDQQHFTHRLRKRGLSDGRVCAVVAGCVAITGVAGLVLTRLDGWWPLLVAAQVGLMLGVIALFESGGRGGRGSSSREKSA